MARYKYEAICFKDCYWQERLWLIGDTYRGDTPPGKWFNEDGETEQEIPRDAGMDPRNNDALRQFLKDHNSSVPKAWTRKRLWAKVTEIENAEAKDGLTNPTDQHEKKPVIKKKR